MDITEAPAESAIATTTPLSHRPTTALGKLREIREEDGEGRGGRE
jgi:hypothetical protein